MRKFSSVTGYPLKQTSPVAIEKELITRVRNDLGTYQDMAIIRPMLKIDSEDGDMSGNVTNAYGTIVVKVINKAFLIPFIIHNKELLPFDVIQMGEQQVSYDMAKLRKLVIELDKAQRENNESGDGFERLVSMRDVPSHNGFLGTIMSIRDEYSVMDDTGSPLYSGHNFGVMDTERMDRRASDAGELFEEFHEKLANVQVFSQQLAKETAESISSRFEKQAQVEILNAQDTGLTKEAAEVKRNIEMLKQDQLRDASICKSGNNISFPTRTGTTFEKRLGRVYHSISPLLSSMKTDIKRIVLDNRGGFTFLKEKEPFMVEDKNPPYFEMKTKIAAGLLVENLYTTEKDTNTIYAPFRVDARYVDDVENSFVLTSPERTKMLMMIKMSECNTLRDIYTCSQEFGVVGSLNTNPSSRRFILVVLKDSKEAFKKWSYSDFETYTTTNETTSDGMRIAKYALERMVVHYLPHDSKNETVPIYVVGEYSNCFFPLEEKMGGHFTKPDGYFNEVFAFEKSAAYENANRARLIVESQNPPRYSLEWTFTDTTEDEPSNYQMEKRMQRGLTPVQAKALLSQLGYDERQKESFFQISKQNGRMAEFRLPSVELAKGIAPEDKGRSKAAEFIRGLVDTTLNSNNFVPAFKETIVSNLGDAAVIGVDNAVNSHKGSVIRDAVSNVLGKEAAHSLIIATELEKIAEHLRGPEWVEVAQMVHVKHHLDKLSQAVTEGFVKEAEHVFNLIPQMEPVIEKCAKNLTLFNREQVMRNDRNIVPGELVKEALTQLDGFCRYASLARNLSEKVNFFKKSPSIQQGVERLDGDLSSLQQAHSSEMSNVRQALVKIKENIKLQADESIIDTLNDTATNHFDRAQGILGEIAENRYEHGLLKGQQENANRLKVVGTMTPLAGAFGLTAAAIGQE